MLVNYQKLFSLEGRIAIVTGAYGYLGSSISKALADFGANVILVEEEINPPNPIKVIFEEKLKHIME